MLLFYFLPFSLFFFKKEKPKKNFSRVLHILTYSSLQSPLGAGPLLASRFEERCQCKVRFINGGSANILIEVLTQNPQEKFDILMGIDQFGLTKARKQFSWLSLNFDDVDWQKDLKGFVWEDFLPYDWSPMTFIYNENNFPKVSWDSLESLTQGGLKRKISLQNPRLSSVGLQFLFWIHSVYGRQGMFTFFDRIKPNIRSISPSWTSSYGLFSKGKKPNYFYLFNVPLVSLERREAKNNLKPWFFQSILGKLNMRPFLKIARSVI